MFDPILPTGSRGYTDIAMNCVYIIDQNLGAQTIHRYNISDSGNCLIFDRTAGPSLLPSYGTHTWYSYKGSHIFLDNGYVLVASNDRHVDMSFYRNFSDATGHDGEYLWMSQPADLPPYDLAVLKSNNAESVFFYEWPSLKLKQEKRYHCLLKQ